MFYIHFKPQPFSPARLLVRVKSFPFSVNKGYLKYLFSNHFTKSKDWCCSILVNLRDYFVMKTYLSIFSGEQRRVMEV